MRSYLFSRIPEEQRQVSVLQLFNAGGIPALAVDAGGEKARGQACPGLMAPGIKHVGARVHGRSGASLAYNSDIVGTLPCGRALQIEVKAPGWYGLDRNHKLRVVRVAGEPSQEQRAFMGAMWSLEDVAALIEGAW